jgi:hypothetical protein
VTTPAIPHERVVAVARGEPPYALGAAFSRHAIDHLTEIAEVCRRDGDERNVRACVCEVERLRRVLVAMLGERYEGERT